MAAGKDCSHCLENGNQKKLHFCFASSQYFDIDAIVFCIVVEVINLPCVCVYTVHVYCETGNFPVQKKISRFIHFSHRENVLLCSNTPGTPHDPVNMVQC